MNSKKFIYLFFFASILFTACMKKWNEPEAKKITDFGITSNPKTTNPETYYEALRTYKKSDHEIAFGWYGNWTGKGASLENSLAGLPDSVDIISMWGGWKNPSPERLADLRFVQQVKGTKALAVFIVQDLGSGNITPDPYHRTMDSIKLYWGWKDGDQASIEQAIKKYANAICDTIDKYNYDGFDIDFEPNYGHAGNLAGPPGGGNVDRKNFEIFVKELGKKLGPLSGSGKLLVVDGEPQSVPPSLGKYFDYFIVQAYAASNDQNLDSRLNSTINNFKGVLSAEEVAKRYVATENFENHALKGGVPYTDRYGNKMMSLEGMARWKPVINGSRVPKGGVGTYHMEYEYIVPDKQGTYPFLRNAIKIMNPPVL